MSASSSEVKALASSSSPNGQEGQTESYDLNDPALFINRELSLLEFNRRVLDEAEDQAYPLLERTKFLAIFSSNMDEFYMIRVAGLMQQVAAGVMDTPADGLTPTEQLVAIRAFVRGSLNRLYHCFKDVQRKLRQAGVYLHDFNELSKTQQKAANQYFREEIFPILTPLAFDPGRPFPHISSLSLNLAVLVHDPDTRAEFFTRIKVPNTLPRLVPIRSGKEDEETVYRFVWLEDLIAHNLADLFPS
jgi:polyphosphate kinase